MNFGRYAQASDGLRPDCRECRKKESRAYYQANREEISRRAKARYAANPEPAKRGRRAYYLANRERVIRTEKQYKKTARGREVGRASWARQHARDPNRFRARLAVARAVKRGDLVRQPCGCGSKKVEAHHHKGYAEQHWLDVVWLCKRCHDAEHKGAAA